MLSPFDLPEGILLLITDELSSPGDFLLHKCLATHVKQSKYSKALILSVSEDLARWKAIAAKSNVDITQLLELGSLTFVDVLSHIESGPETPRFSLRPLLDVIFPTLQSDAGPLLVIIDDITSLQWIGASLLDVTRFIRALRAQCIHANATLIIRHHITTPDPDDLFCNLLQLCTYYMDVRPLTSGRSGAVSGAIALHSGPSTPLGSDGVKLIPRSLAIQYRLTDTGAVFINRGTAEGVL